MSRKKPKDPPGPADAARPEAKTGARPMHCAADIAQRIQRMAQLVHNAANPLMDHGLSAAQAAALAEGHGGGAAPDPIAPDSNAGGPGADDSGLGWWVLAQGRLLDPEDFATREAAREDLLAAVRKAGVLVGENVWVWDETGRAQLVLATLPTLERARRVAERLRAKGLNITVRREMPQAL
ncbi:hypothetical protein [Humidesulfovibrio idahonensis]